MHIIFLKQLHDLHPVLAPRAAAAVAVAVAAAVVVAVVDAAVAATVVDEGGVTDLGPDLAPPGAAPEMCLPRMASMRMMIQRTGRRSTLATSIIGSVVLTAYCFYVPNLCYLCRLK